MAAVASRCALGPGRPASVLTSPVRKAVGGQLSRVLTQCGWGPGAHGPSPECKQKKGRGKIVPHPVLEWGSSPWKEDRALVPSKAVSPE